MKLMACLKIEFKKCFCRYKKNPKSFTIILLISSLDVQPNGEWIKETVKVFKCNKVSFIWKSLNSKYMRVLKNVCTEKYSQTEIDFFYDGFWLKFESEKKFIILKKLIVKMYNVKK
jgi:hypothetical protein